jgi:hypothetical protein
MSPDDETAAFALADIVPGTMLRGICDGDVNKHADLNPQLKDVYSSACAETLTDPHNNLNEPVLFVRRIRQKNVYCPLLSGDIDVDPIEKPYVLFCGSLSPSASASASASKTS